MGDRLCDMCHGRSHMCHSSHMQQVTCHMNHSISIIVSHVSQSSNVKSLTSLWANHCGWLIGNLQSERTQRQACFISLKWKLSLQNHRINVFLSLMHTYTCTNKLCSSISARCQSALPFLFFILVWKNGKISQDLQISPDTQSTQRPGEATMASATGPIMQEFLATKSELQLRNYLVKMEGGVARSDHQQ